MASSSEGEITDKLPTVPVFPGRSSFGTENPESWKPYLLAFWDQEDRFKFWLCHFLAV